MDRFDVEAQYKRSLAALDTLVDIEVNSADSSSERVSLLYEGFQKIEEALVLLSIEKD